MADNLMEMAVGHLGSSGLSALGKTLGLPAGQEESGVNAGMATVLAGMLIKVSSENGLSALLNLASNSDAIDLSSITEIFGDPEKLASLQHSGGNNLSDIFGANLGRVCDGVSSALGLDGAKSSSLLHMVAPMVIALVGKLVKSKNLKEKDLASLLLEQKPYLKDKLPAGMLSSLGVSSLDELGQRTVNATAAQPVKKRGGAAKWLWPLLVALVAFYALNMCAKKDAMNNNAGNVLIEEDDVIVEEVPDVAPTISQAITRQPKADSFAQSFRQYLASDTRDPNRAFLLNIAFPTNGAIPLNQSIADVQALIKIMRENPRLSIAIEGYTNSSGDASSNQQLSEQRAEAVRQLLVAGGIDANRVSAMGMGTATPIAESSRAESEVENHRIAVRVINFN